MCDELFYLVISLYNRYLLGRIPLLCYHGLEGPAISLTDATVSDGVDDKEQHLSILRREEEATIQSLATTPAPGSFLTKSTPQQRFRERWQNQPEEDLQRHTG
ncbi:hypothetical protein J437_LFUL017767 [Ladona fulva]|uniref:Uncharacterized protein n=1 Tax=Ladona fulva TaxID=123851 RepID=A0A8K0KRK6_LADFU|nr:hypothetical protein J437_LFUL017767 [Ladona fulva]